MEHITCEALRVDADKGRGGGDLSHDQCNGFFDAAVTVLPGLSAEAVDAELSPASRKFRGGYLPYFAGHIIPYRAWQAAMRADRLKPSTRYRLRALMGAGEVDPR
jgi:hypothetical protein